MLLLPAGMLDSGQGVRRPRVFCAWHPGARHREMTKNTKRPDLFDQAAVELVKLQKHVIATEKKLLIIVEGRDGAGKDGLIKRVTKHMSPRETRIVALRQARATGIARPGTSSAGLLTCRSAARSCSSTCSWYNRAGVERVMGFCTEAEYNELPADRAAIRAAPRPLRHHDSEILSRHLESRAEAPTGRAPRRPAQAVEAQRRRR